MAVTGEVGNVAEGEFIWIVFVFFGESAVCGIGAVGSNADDVGSRNPVVGRQVVVSMGISAGIGELFAFPKVHLQAVVTLYDDK